MNKGLYLATFFVFLLCIITLPVSKSSASFLTQSTKDASSATVATIISEIKDYSPIVLSYPIYQTPTTTNTFSFEITNQQEDKISQVDQNYELYLDSNIPYALIENQSIQLQASLSTDFSDQLATLSASQTQTGTRFHITDERLTSKANEPYTQSISIKITIQPSYFSANSQYQISSIQLESKQVD